MSVIEPANQFSHKQPSDIDVHEVNKTEVT